MTDVVQKAAQLLLSELSGAFHALCDVDPQGEKLRCEHVGKKEAL